MSVKTETRPQKQETAETDYDILEHADEIIERHLNSPWVKHYEATVNEEGHIVIPDDFPEEWMEAWDGENVRKV
jgi:hypothetical protein